jgi:hypothetical protein
LDAQDQVTGSPEIRPIDQLRPWKERLPGGPEAASIGLAAFAMLWAVIRAAVQDVTGDEAESYHFFASRVNASHWAPYSNNHLLNSMLMRLFTGVFGLSPLTVRAPALLGALLYIWGAWWLSKHLSTDWKVRIPVLVCLVYNPYIFDFFVAARGYGMALGFLLVALAVTGWYQQGIRQGLARPVQKVCGLVSILIALCFTANFSFAFAGIAAFFVLMAWILRTRPRSEWGRLVLAGSIPGMLLIVMLPLWTVLHWPKGQLWDGATSMQETFSTLAESSLYQPSRYLLNPMIYRWVHSMGKFILPVLFATAVLQAGLLIVRRPAWKRDAEWWPAGLGIASAVIVLLSLAMHWLAYEFFGLRMPRNRTALFLIPLVTLIVGSIAALPAFSGAARGVRVLLAGLLFALSFYYLTCMRLTYFREWDYQADLKKVYGVVACYSHARGVRDVEVSWYYHEGMNFYRVLSGHENLTPFTNLRPHPIDKQLYVLNIGFEKDFIDAQKLVVVYRGENTDMVVAARPELADAASKECYIPPM